MKPLKNTEPKRIKRERIGFKNWKIARGHNQGNRSKRWIQKNKEYATHVQVSNTFVGDRKPEVNIWKQHINIKTEEPTSMADYIFSEKKFKTKSQAFAYAKAYMRKH